MAYLNLDLDYFDHPKTRRLIGLLGKGSEVIPIRVWAYCGRYHARDGKLTGYSAQEIESVVGWWGPAGEMVTALIKVGFLEEVNGEYQVHDWLDHSGHIEAIKQRNKKNIMARWEKIKQKEEEGDTKTIPVEYQNSTSGIPFLNPSILSNPSKKNNGKFVPPTLEEVKAYCLERNNGIDAQHFIDSNTAKGWVIGKNKTPAKDWKAMVRTWEQNNKEKPGNTGSLDAAGRTLKYV